MKARRRTAKRKYPSRKGLKRSSIFRWDQTANSIIKKIGKGWHK